MAERVTLEAISVLFDNKLTEKLGPLKHQVLELSSIIDDLKSSIQFMSDNYSLMLQNTSLK